MRTALLDLTASILAVAVFHLLWCIDVFRLQYHIASIPTARELGILKRAGDEHIPLNCNQLSEENAGLMIKYGRNLHSTYSVKLHPTYSGAVASLLYSRDCLKYPKMVSLTKTRLLASRKC